MITKLLQFWLVIFVNSFVTTLRAQEFPNPNWNYNSNPEKAGWDPDQLNRLRKTITDSTFITGFMIIQKGRIVFEFGDVQENSYIASCRKSVLAMIYGPHVRDGEIDLNKSLNDMGVDDIGGLLPIEKKATIKDIISARSGVFHEASYPGDYLEYAPKRGSVEPGTYWLYSNWDFNMAGYIFEKETNKSIYDEVERILAIPLHMQDWNKSLQKKEGDTTKSYYKAYPMWFSTRDMARIGLLLLNKGKWGDKEILDEEWIREMTTSKTSYIEVNKSIPSYRNAPFYFGYGYMWWLWENSKDQRFRGGFSAMGSMGQSITVFPEIDVVIAFKTKEEYERSTPFEARFKVLLYAVKAFVSNH